MDFPGHVIKAGESDSAIVTAVKAQLNRTLSLPNGSAPKLDEDNPEFGPMVAQAVKLFQAQHVDADGRPLKPDGQIGPITWGILFGHDTVPSVIAAPSEYFARIVRIAGAEAESKVREVPANSNRGPRVQQYQARAGSPTGLAWCCSFVYWCYDEAAKAVGRTNPMLKSASCINHWGGAVGAGAKRILRARALADPSLLAPGMIFIMDHGGGFGHTGIIERVNGGLLSTIEGNTDASKTREGGGVYRLTRKIVEINPGYISYVAS
jgi:hypothetical protein